MRNINKYTEDYLANDFETYQVEYRRRKAVEQIEKYHPQRILEIGCGSEPLFQFVKDKEWVIAEPSNIFCENAREKKKDTDNVAVCQGFFEEKIDELEKNKFDMVICSSLLHEVECPGKMLDGIFRILKDRGILYVDVPNGKSFHRVLAKHMGLIADELEKSEMNIRLQQNMVFDMESLQGILMEHHFEIVEKGSYFVKPFTHGQMYELLENKIIDKKVLDGLYSMTVDFPALGSEIFVNCKKAGERNDKK